VDVLGHKEAIYPYTSPALFSMSAGFAGIWLFSVLDKSERARLDRAGFEAQKVRSETRAEFFSTTRAPDRCSKLSTAPG